MTNTTKPGKIDTDPRTAEARCAHHNLFGNVCDVCFDATANLVECAGAVYHLPAWQIAEEREEDSTLYARISAATVLPVSVAPIEVKVGDRIALGTRPLLVAHIENAGPVGIDFTDALGKRYRIDELSIPVFR